MKKGAASPGQLHNLAYAYGQRGQHDKAAQTVAELVKNAPERRETRLLYAEELEQAGQSEDARAAYEALRRDAPASAEGQRAAEGVTRLRRGNATP